MTIPLLPYASWTLIAERLPLIFPEGTPNRGYCIREMAAKTVFVAHYIGAVEGGVRALQPAHVYRMTEEHASLFDDDDRFSYATDFLKKAKQKQLASGTRWYADNSREPIRDETLRDGLVPIGAVIKSEDMATTSNLPRYVLKADFAALLNPNLTGDDLQKAIEVFQATHLSPSARARVSLMLAGATTKKAGVLVTFPNGETRTLSPGPSSVITKAVVETFAPTFLGQPAVMWLSESGNKVTARADKNLPDLILVDLAPQHPLLVFVEVVATDGAITERRQEAIYKLTDVAGFPRSQVAFLTAYQDRGSAGFKKTVSQLAWGSFAWFSSEPDHILVMRDGAISKATLSALLAT
jgi:hypothetical protein